MAADRAFACDTISCDESAVASVGAVVGDGTGFVTVSAVIQGQMALILVSALPVLMSLYPVPVLIPAQS